MTSKNKVKSLRIRFIAFCVAAITLILAGFGMVQYAGRWNDFKRSLSADLEAAGVRLTITLPAPMWAYDAEMAGNTLSSELSNPSFVGLAILLKDGSFFAGVKGSSKEPSGFNPGDATLAAREKDAEFPVLKDGEEIGKAVIRYTDNVIIGELRASLVSTVIQIVVIDIALSLIVAFLVTTMVVRPLSFIATNLQEISQGEGDLTRDLPVKGNNEIAHLSTAFNFFQGKLSAIINGMRRSLSELKDLGHELNANSTQTAAAIHEITANINSIRTETSRQSDAVANTSETVKLVNLTVEELGARTEAQFGNIQVSSSAIEEMVANIQSVTSVVENLDKEFKSLVEASEIGRSMLSQVNEKVSAITASSENLLEANVLISNIASQTNLLAMNAAIEAAHAGEFGRGFSVVASEIRKLAENASSQAKDTYAMIAEITEAISTAGPATQEAETAFNNIMSRLEKITALEHQIDRAMKEQSEGSTQILDNLKDMHESSRAVRESTTRINELNMRITSEVETISEISNQVHGSMDEISIGTQEVNLAVTQISDLSFKNRDIIEVANEDVSKFRTKDNCE